MLFFFTKQPLANFSQKTKSEHHNISFLHIHLESMGILSRGPLIVVFGRVADQAWAHGSLETEEEAWWRRRQRRKRPSRCSSSGGSTAPFFPEARDSLNGESSLVGCKWPYIPVMWKKVRVSVNHLHIISLGYIRLKAYQIVRSLCQLATHYQLTLTFRYLCIIISQVFPNALSLFMNHESKFWKQKKVSSMHRMRRERESRTLHAYVRAFAAFGLKLLKSHFESEKLASEELLSFWLDLSNLLIALDLSCWWGEKTTGFFSFGCILNVTKLALRSNAFGASPPSDSL